MQAAKLVEVVFLHLAGMVVERVDGDDSEVRIWVRSRQVDAVCPDCGIVSAGVHSRYQRRLNDRPVSGRPVVIVLTVHRFFCPHTGCSRRTFAEQFDGLAGRRRRRTVGLLGMLQPVAVTLASRPGARLAGRMAVVVSRMTLLRLVRALPEPPVSTPLVLGVDDFALRRGEVYASVLLDMVEATARAWSWAWAQPQRAAALGVTVGAALLTVLLAPLLTTRMELPLDQPDPLARMLDVSGGVTSAVVAIVAAAALSVPLAGILGRKLHDMGKRVGPPLAGLAVTALLTVGGVLALQTLDAPVYGDTLVVSLCGTNPSNIDRCPEPVNDTDKLYLIDYIRQHGGSTREYEHDNVTYLEVTAIPGGGTRLAGLVLAREGVDTIESLP